MKHINFFAGGIFLIALCACAADNSTAPAEHFKGSPRFEGGAGSETLICANAANTTGAFNVGTRNPAWGVLTGMFAAGGWIGPVVNSNTALVPVGNYTYVTSFTGVSRAKLSGSILADNGASVYLNDDVTPVVTLGAIDDTTVPSYATMQNPTFFTAYAGIVSGANTLKVVVYNATPAGPSGTSYCFTVSIPTNAPPVASVGGPYEGFEGSSTSLALTASDADNGDVLTYAWDLGDGTTGSGSAAPTSHIYTDNGAYVVSLTVTDGDGGTSTATTTATIANVAPVLGAITVSSSLVSLGTSVSVSAPVTDAGSADTHTALIEWEDGVLVVNAAAGGVGGIHTYTSAGVYTVKITATDDDGGVSNTASYQYVVVYDPSSGFVTGGGWIMSPLGAYAADPSISGKASFGFVSRYQKGATIPTGTTEFQFQAGGLGFRSTSYQWLVIAGPKAQYKGDGAVNGVAGYKFLLTATDGQVSGGGGVDKFRIKITDSTGSVIYDNQTGDSEAADATTTLGGGSIVIHSR